MSEPATNPGEHDALDLLETLMVKGMGPVIVRRLIERFGSWSTVKRSGERELREAGVKADAVRALRAGDLHAAAAEQMALCESLGIHVVPYTSETYPQALHPYDSSPLLLFIKGGLLERDAVAVAVVGTRRASLYGKMQAERLAFELAHAGFTIVSGLARGIDAAAHEGALKAGGRTLAVLGNGLASIYPPEHEDLAGRIVESGALVTELLPGVGPNAANFPPRNRIIAGLSLGVVVVEAPERSGAVITARLAGEMGKEVFAVPGDISRPQTRGAHRLIRDGAKLVETVDDIIEELGPLAQPVCVDKAHPPLADVRALTLNTHERTVYDLLDTSPQDIDTITRQAGLSPANVASTLMVLELKKLAVQTPGKQYARASSRL